MTPTTALEAVVEGPTRGPKRLLVWILKLVVAAVIVGLAIRLALSFGWAGLVDRLSTASPLLAAAGAAALAARYWVWQHRWARAALHFEEAPRAQRRFGAVCASVLVNHATPSIRIFGSLLRARYLARGGRAPFVPQYAVVLYEQMVHMVVSTGTFWLAGSAIAWRLGYRWLGAGSILAGLLALAWLFHRRHRGRRSRESPWFEIAKRRIWALTHRLPPLAMHGHELVGDVAALIRDRRIRPAVLFWTLIFTVLNIGAQWILFRALGVHVHPFVVAGVIGAGTVVGALTGSPGGLATTEAAMAAGYVALGVAQVDAAAATLLYRGFHYLVVLGFGVPALVYFEVFERHSRDRPPAVTERPSRAPEDASASRSSGEGSPDDRES